MITIEYAVEGASDTAIAERLIRSCGGHPVRRITAGGKRKLDARIPALNQLGRHTPWFVVRDCDNDDAPFGGSQELLIDSLMGGPRSNFFNLCLAVRAVEAWVLADPDTVSSHFGVARSKVPPQPDDLQDPKKRFVDLLATSRRRDIREAMVPAPKSGRKIGPEYVAYLNEYSENTWSIERAKVNSPSLLRAVERLSSLTEAVRKGSAD